MQNQLLLLEDVSNLGRKGDLVKAKPGFVRNYLLPKKKAVIVDKRTLRMRERLQEERAKQSVIDKKESEELAKVLAEKVLSITVKVDTAGHLYGSVSTGDIASLLETEGFSVDKRSIQLAHAIKKSGNYDISLKLKEGVVGSFTLNVIGEGQIAKVEEIVEEVEKEEENPS